MIFKISPIIINLGGVLNIFIFMYRGRYVNYFEIGNPRCGTKHPFIHYSLKHTGSNYIIYLDANNLYGGAMSEPMPYGDFKFEEVTSDLVNKILEHPEDSDIGYLLSCDLEYKDKKFTSRFPLAPEVIIPCMYDLNPNYQHPLNNFKPPTTEKLVCNVKDKVDYVIHYRNLQFYRKLGMAIKSVQLLILLKIFGS